MQSTITLRRTDSGDVQFQELIKQLDKDLRDIYGELQSFYDQFNKTDMIKNVVVVYDGKRPIGCGSFKEFDKHSVEIKRMYVESKSRNKGVGALILHDLESWAKECGYKVSILETGTDQPFAVALYEKVGYKVSERYGEYIDVETSICMRKDL